MQYLEAMKAILPLVLLFLSTTLLAQNIPSIEQVEAELEELKKKDDLRAYTLEIARQRDSLIEVFDKQFFNLEQELSSTETFLSQLEFDFDNAMTSIEALNQNKEMLENKNDKLNQENISSKDSLLRLKEANSLLETRIDICSSTDSLFSYINSLKPAYQLGGVEIHAPYTLSAINESNSPKFLSFTSETVCRNNGVHCWYDLPMNNPDDWDNRPIKFLFFRPIGVLYFIINNRATILPLTEWIYNTLENPMQHGSRDNGSMTFKSGDLEVKVEWSYAGTPRTWGSVYVYYKGEEISTIESIDFFD